MTRVPPSAPTETTPNAAAPRQRSALRSVAVPTEHGGWGLTLEAVVLGLAVRWSAAGACLGAAAFLAFLARTPLKTALVDLRRHRSLPRTRLALKVLIVEGIALVALVAVAAALDTPAFWAPLVVMAPFAALELWFDMRSRSRRLIPELAGAVGVGGVVALVVLAGGGSGHLAVACWLILAARSISAITTVRDMVGSLHGRRRQPALVLGADALAMIVAAIAVVLDDAVAVGGAAVVAAVAVQRALNLRPAPRAVIIGVRQTILGLVVIAATAIGVLWA